jgi:hypothetical protein
MGSDWNELRGRRLSEPGAAEAYEAARLAFELGRKVREIREQRGWTRIAGVVPPLPPTEKSR